MRNIFFVKLTILILLISVAGCNQVKYRGISANPDAYFLESYNLNKLPGQIKHKFKMFDRGEIKGPVIIKLTQDITRTDVENMSVLKIYSITKIEKLGLGVVRSIEAKFEKGVLYARVMEMSYNGVLKLKKETFKKSEKIASHFNGVKSIDKINFDISNMDMNKNYKIIYQAGHKQDEYNYEKYEIECIRKNKINANELNASLEGTAIEVRCNYYFKGDVSSTRKYWYLESYGFSVISEINDSASMTIFKIRDIRPIL